MSLQILTIVENSDDFNSPFPSAIDQTMPGILHTVARHAIAAKPEMPRAHSGSEIGTIRRTDSFRIGLNIPQSLADGLVAECSCFAEFP